jgi:predicted nucleic acid-binding protein
MVPYDVPPLNNEMAWSVYRDFIEHKRITFAKEPDGIDRCWERLSAGPAASPKLWMDAYLAAFAIAGKHRLLTTDTGFRQFPDLQVLVLGT